MKNAERFWGVASAAALFLLLMVVAGIAVLSIKQHSQPCTPVQQQAAPKDIPAQEVFQTTLDTLVKGCSKMQEANLRKNGKELCERLIVQMYNQGQK